MQKKRKAKAGEEHAEGDKKSKAHEAPVEEKAEEAGPSDDEIRKRILANVGSEFEPALVIKFHPSKPHKAVKGLTFPLQLEYFGVRGLCEPIRLVLEEAQVPYVFTAKKTTVDEREASTPFGSVPVLRGADGFPFFNGALPQSGSIVRYLAGKLSLDKKSAEDRAAVDAIFELAKDLVGYVEQIYAEDKSDKNWNYVKLKRLLQKAEAHLEGDYYFDKVTYADLTMFAVLQTFEESKHGVLKADFKADKLEGFRQRVADRPNIKAYLQSVRRFPPTWRDLRRPGWQEKPSAWCVEPKKEEAAPKEAEAAAPSSS